MNEGDTACAHKDRKERDAERGGDEDGSQPAHYVDTLESLDRHSS